MSAQVPDVENLRQRPGSVGLLPKPLCSSPSAPSCVTIPVAWTLLEKLNLLK